MNEYNAIKNNTTAGIKNNSPFLIQLAQNQLDQCRDILTLEQVLELETLLSTKIGSKKTVIQPTVSNIPEEDDNCEVCSS